MRRGVLLLVLLAWACGEEEADGPDAAVVDASIEMDAADDAPDAEVDDEVDAEIDEGPDAAPITPGVGYYEERIFYETPNGMGSRRLPVYWWYPAIPEGPPALYLGSIARTDVHTNAPPLIEGQAPVLVFSHGSGGFAQQSWWLTEGFAAAGFVVVSIDHINNTFNDMSGGSEMFELRPADIRAVIDHLATLPPEHPLAGHVEVSRVALAGHSFGGYTTLALSGAAYDLAAAEAVCAEGNNDVCDVLESSRERFAAGLRDERVAVAVPMTPGGYALFQNGLADISIPTLLVTAALDQTLPDAEEGTPIWEGLAGADDMRVQFTNAGHFSFISVCNLLGRFGVDDGCGPQFTPTDRVGQITLDYALAFVRLHLLGDDSGRTLLDGPSPDPEVEISRKAGAP